MSIPRELWDHPENDPNSQKSRENKISGVSRLETEQGHQGHHLSSLGIPRELRDNPEQDPPGRNQKSEIPAASTGSLHTELPPNPAAQKNLPGIKRGTNLQMNFHQDCPCSLQVPSGLEIKCSMFIAEVSHFWREKIIKFKKIN